jgi:ABC-type phosphate transport system substrate-binding protein
MIRTAPVKALAVAALGTAVLAVPAAAEATTLTGSGSSAAQPYMLELFKTYSSLHHSIKFKYIPDGGNAGVKDVQDHRSQFAINTRPPEPSDAGTTYVKLFLDGLCIAVNPHNSITNITIPALKNIFLGVDTSWSQVGGSSLSTTIDPIGRNSASGQYTFFQSSVLGGATQASNVAEETADGLVQTRVGSDPNAIGYVGLSHSGKPAKKITVNGVSCTPPNIRSEKYPLWRYDWGVVPTKGANRNVIAFLRWAATNKTARSVEAKAGAVPLG